MNASRFRRWTDYGIFRCMKFRLLAHCLVLALFVTATTLSAVVSPAQAGYGRTDPAEAVMAMDADMPCCPPDQGKAKDCTTNCPAFSYCLAKCFASEPTAFVMLGRSIVAVVGLAGDDVVRASWPFEPPARPPRT